MAAWLEEKPEGWGATVIFRKGNSTRIQSGPLRKDIQHAWGDVSSNASALLECVTLYPLDRQGV